MDENIKKLWKAMEMDLRQKDNHSDWQCKGIVMVSPWDLQIHSYAEAFEEHETTLDFVLQTAVRKEDFDESAIPADLLEIIKKDSYFYPNVVEAGVYGSNTLEEAIEKMRQKLRLLEYGYILMDDSFYRNEILDDDDYDDDDDDDWLFDDEDDEDDKDDE